MYSINLKQYCDSNFVITIPAGFTRLIELLPNIFESKGGETVYKTTNSCKEDFKNKMISFDFTKLSNY